MNKEIDERVRPFEETLERVDDIPGIGRRTAEDVLVEIGVDVGRFASAQQLAS